MSQVIVTVAHILGPAHTEQSIWHVRRGEYILLLADDEIEMHWEYLSEFPSMAYVLWWTACLFGRLAAYPVIPPDLKRNY